MLLGTCNYPGKNAGVGCHSLLQGIFLILESKPESSDYRQILYCLSYKESPYTQPYKLGIPIISIREMRRLKHIEVK